MEFLWISLGSLLVLTGIFGSLLPVLPGPPLSYAGLLFLQLTNPPPFNVTFLVVLAVIVIIVTILENFIPAYGTKKWGGSRLGIIGSLAGLITGLFFPPIGIIIGPLIGAFIGEMIAGSSSDNAFRAAVGSFVGLLAGTLLKFITSLVIGYYFIINI